MNKVNAKEIQTFLEVISAKVEQVKIGTIPKYPQILYQIGSLQKQLSDLSNNPGLQIPALKNKLIELFNKIEFVDKQDLFTNLSGAKIPKELGNLGKLLEIAARPCDTIYERTNRIKDYVKIGELTQAKELYFDKYELSPFPSYWEAVFLIRECVDKGETENALELLELVPEEVEDVPNNATKEELSLKQDVANLLQKKIIKPERYLQKAVLDLINKKDSKLESWVPINVNFAPIIYKDHWKY